MKYKLIASDFDGTIYTSDYHIAKGTKEAFLDYKRAGGIVMVSTGRLYKSISCHFDNLGLDSGAAIVEQGANVVDIKSGKVILSYDIDNDVASSCLARMEMEKEYSTLIYYKGDCYAKESTPLIEFFGKIIMVDIHYVGVKMSEYVKENGIKPSKLLAICMPGEQGLKSDIWAKEYPSLGFARSTEFLVEVVDGKAGKGNALKYIAEDVYHLKREEVIALGDAENDLSMIEYAGLGVAMGNAMDRLKSVADIIADTNDNSGVAKIVRKYGLGEEI